MILAEKKKILNLALLIYPTPAYSTQTIFYFIFAFLYCNFTELPEILMAPQNQTIKVGKSFVLECDADGNPIPTITWQLNGAAIAANEHLVLENENTELIVNKARESDTGKEIKKKETLPNQLARMAGRLGEAGIRWRTGLKNF